MTPFLLLLAMLIIADKLERRSREKHEYEPMTEYEAEQALDDDRKRWNKYLNTGEW